MTATVLLQKGWRNKAQANLLSFLPNLKSLAPLSYVLILLHIILEGGGGEEGHFFWYSVPHLCPQIG